MLALSKASSALRYSSEPETSGSDFEPTCVRVIGYHRPPKQRLRNGRKNSPLDLSDQVQLSRDALKSHRSSFRFPRACFAAIEFKSVLVHQRIQRGNVRCIKEMFTQKVVRISHRNRGVNGWNVNGLTAFLISQASALSAINLSSFFFCSSSSFL